MNTGGVCVCEGLCCNFNSSVDTCGNLQVHERRTTWEENIERV